MRHKIPPEMVAVARALGDLRERFVFVGGMVRSVLVSDPAVDGPRPTIDVDVIVHAETRSAFAHLEEQLRARGFHEDMSEGAPICRRVLRGAGPSGTDVPVDFMPDNPVVLGFSNVWYPGALRSALRVETEAGPIRITHAPHFLAMKLESFLSRGESDYAHRDLEDAVVLVDGRPELRRSCREPPRTSRRSSLNNGGPCSATRVFETPSLGIFLRTRRARRDCLCC